MNIICRWILKFESERAVDGATSLVRYYSKLCNLQHNRKHSCVIIKHGYVPFLLCSTHLNGSIIITYLRYMCNVLHWVSTAVIMSLIAGAVPWLVHRHSKRPPISLGPLCLCYRPSVCHLCSFLCQVQGRCMQITACSMVTIHYLTQSAHFWNDVYIAVSISHCRLSAHYFLLSLLI